MKAALLTPLPVEEYLEGEQRSEIRHEYVAGQVYAMAGAKLRHNAIVRNLAVLLGQHKKTFCEFFIADMKVRVRSIDAFYYPDIVLRCGTPLPGDSLYLEDPCLVIEVLSASTANIDRREKLHAYQALPSLREYVLVDSDSRSIELYRRRPEGWWYELLGESEGDSLRFQCVDLALSLAEVYAGVDLPAAPVTD
ncbi:MAG: Uma2 family endonuclease [Acidithiobacillus sp.]